MSLPEGHKECTLPILILFKGEICNSYRPTPEVCMQYRNTNPEGKARGMSASILHNPRHGEMVDSINRKVLIIHCT